MSSTRWVCRTLDVKELFESQIGQLQKDLEGSTFEQIDEEGERVGWRQLLAERMHLIDPSVQTQSYVRRIYNVMEENYLVISAHFADVACCALGLNSSVYLTTYPNTRKACAEMVKEEAALAGQHITDKAALNVARERFPKLEAEMYPNGKYETPYQLKVRQYDSKKNRRKTK